MRWRGWFRLWVVLSVFAVPLLAYALAKPDLDTWSNLNANAIRICVDQESAEPGHSANACIHRMGADQTPFQREHTTPLAYWSEALFFGLVADLILTAVIAAAVAAVMWVQRGFRLGY